MKVVWTPESLQDRLDIWDYIAADNRRAAIKIDTMFSNAAAKLATHPDLGRTGMVRSESSFEERNSSSALGTFSPTSFFPAENLTSEIFSSGSDWASRLAES